MLAAGDHVRLGFLVGAATMARGRKYAEKGAVLRSAWDETGTRVSGLVQGSDMEPYATSVTVVRAANGALARIKGDCDCPVGTNCKHAVALLLSSPAARTPAAPPVPVPTPAYEEPWRSRLEALLRPAEPSRAADPFDRYGSTEPRRLGLQFELNENRPDPSRRSAGQTGPGVRLRPLTLSAAGNWVRTGISWSSLDYYSGWRTAGLADEHVALLKELRALNHLSSFYQWRVAGDEAVWLEQIPSRRVWDLLRHARHCGVSLLTADRPPAPVDLHDEPAGLVMDVSAAAGALSVAPVLVAGDEALPQGRFLLVGAPAHGVVWWDARGLHATHLAEPLPAAHADLLGSGPVTIPAGEAEHFERRVYPRLRRQLTFVSSDESYEPPEPVADVVVCTVTHRPGPALHVAWTLVAGGGAGRPVWEEPDTGAEKALAEAAAVLGRVGPPIDADLAGMEAVRFVVDLLPALRSVPSLRVEEQGEPADYREVTEVPTVLFQGEDGPGGDWLDLSIDVTVGGEEVPFAELFMALAAGRREMVLPSGAWFSLESDELRQLAELIDEARALHETPPGRVRISRFSLSLWDDLAALGEVKGQAGAWLASLRRLAGGDERERPLPDTLNATLRPYQEQGFQWLATRFEHGLGAVLADDMGLGKTVQALALACHAQASDPSARFLVVAPTSVVGNWVSEADRFAPGLGAVAVTETTRKRRRPLADLVAGSRLVVTSYTLLRLDFEEYASIGWAGLFLDEAQFAKNPSSQYYKCARRLPTAFKLAMTGTPLENHLGELWALLSIASPGLFPSAERFVEMYRTPIERHGNEERLARLRRRIQPLMLRRTKADVVADLPDKQEQVLELDLDPKHARLYSRLLQRERQKILGLISDMDENRFEILRSLTLLRQAALDMSLVDDEAGAVPSAKLDLLVEMVSEAAGDGHRVLVFSQFTRFLGSARDRLRAAGIDCCYLDGRTRRRAEVIESFRSGQAPVFLISLKAGGFGLNLTEADHCILLDPWWNPATESQAVDRLHRIGQTRKVMVYRLVARQTIEEKVMALKERKARLFAGVVEGGGFETAGLSATDVAELLGG